MGIKTISDAAGILVTGKSRLKKRWPQVQQGLGRRIHPARTHGKRAAIFFFDLAKSR
jgi:hypothetical protein